MTGWSIHMAEPDEAEDKIEIVIHVNMQKEVITSISSIIVDLA